MNYYWQQLLSVAKACHIFASTMVEEDREHIRHLTSVVHAASGKMEATHLLLHFCGDRVSVGQALWFPACTCIVACTNITSL